MNHISEEDLIKSIENMIAFLPIVHIGTTHLEILLEEFKKEKEKNKKLEEEKKQAFKDYNSTAGELMDVINLMVEELTADEFDNPCCECCQECERDHDTLYNCIKAYYFNKVKEIKNDK